MSLAIAGASAALLIAGACSAAVVGASTAPVSRSRFRWVAASGTTTTSTSTTSTTAAPPTTAAAPTTAPPPATTVRRTATAPSRATTAPTLPPGLRQPSRTVGVTHYTPPPLPPPPPPPPCDRKCTRRPGPPRALVLGDSLAYQAAPFVTETLHAEGFQVFSRAVAGTGLLQGLNPFSWVPSGWDWLTEMRSLVAQDDPDVVVAEFIGVYFPPADGSGLAYGSDAFKAAWGRATEEAMQILTAKHATVYWVLVPPMKGELLNEVAHEVNDIYRNLISRWNQTPLQDAVQYIDESTPFSNPDGSFAEYLPGADGTPVLMRWPDGVHLTDAALAIYIHRIGQMLGTYSQTTFRAPVTSPP